MSAILRLPPDPDPRASLRGLRVLALFILADAHCAVLRDPRRAVPLLAWLALLPVWAVLFALVYGRGEQDERVRFLLEATEDEPRFLPAYVRRWLEDVLEESAPEGRKGARR